MHYTALTAAALVGSAFAGAYYEEPTYLTTSSKVYTSVSTCTEKPTYETTSAPVYYAPSSSAAAPYEVTYTSYEHVTVTSCADYVTSCPAKTYTSAAYSVSTCTGEYVPTDVPYYAPSASEVPYYVPPANTTEYAPPVYETPAPYYPTESETYTQTYYTTVCPGANYCYGTTITSTYCPGSTPVYVATTPVYVPPAVSTSTYCPPSTTEVYVPPVYTAAPVYPAPNATETYTPPAYTGAASSNAVSFGVAAIAGLVALLIAA
jgi:hypothetical protein